MNRSDNRHVYNKCNFFHGCTLIMHLFLLFFSFLCHIALRVNCCLTDYTFVYTAIIWVVEVKGIFNNTLRKKIIPLVIRSFSIFDLQLTAIMI